MEKYFFVLENTRKERVSGHAHTLLGVKFIFKKVTNASKCYVSKRIHDHYSITPIVVYQK